MKAALCNFCLKSGILCSSCQRKLKSGEISEMDFEIARMLLSLENMYPQLQDIFFDKAVETKSIVAIVVGKGDMVHFLGHGGKILRELRSKVGKRILVLEDGTNNRKFLEDLFTPLNIIAINRIWLPDGTTETRVILRKRGRRPSSTNLDALKEIARKLRGLTLRVEFTD